MLKRTSECAWIHPGQPCIEVFMYEAGCIYTYILILYESKVRLMNVETNDERNETWAQNVQTKNSQIFRFIFFRMV